MAALVKYTAFEPIVTGGLLWVLTRGSPDLRASVLRPLASLPFQIETPTLVKALKWLFAVGVFSRINGLLNNFAKNNWTFSDGGRAWNWPTEVAAITGGSGGIGSIVVEKLAAKGIKVAIMDLQPPAPALRSRPNVFFFECDVTNPENVEAVAKKIKAEVGAPSILFNNAGILRPYNITEMPPKALKLIFDINVLSHWYTTKAFLPDMITGKKGHIISTCSMASYVQVAGMVDYCVTKAAAMSFQEGLKQELKHRYNAPFVKTTSIHPYWVKTNLLSSWSDSLIPFSDPTMTPEYVGGQIADAILSGQSQTVNLPKHMTVASSVRSFSHWLHELVNDSQKHVTASFAKH